MSAGFLAGIRVLEIADELGEYCGKVLAGMGADVVKIEPPGGERTRGYGPFHEDVPGPDRSLHFWHYNFGKRSLVLDLDAPDGRDRLRRLAGHADVLLDTRPRGYLQARGLGFDALRAVNPALIAARITPFGDTGPWADFKGSDLVHLALGGVAHNNGYDPDPSGFYETPPIAPQMWQAYHIAGEMAVMGILGALCHRAAGGGGQQVSTAVHEAVALQTETDLPNWIYARQPHSRRTGRHSRPDPDAPAMALTKDGRWILPYFSYLASTRGDAFVQTVKVLERYGAADDLKDERYQSLAARTAPHFVAHLGDVQARFVGRFLFETEIWREFQAAGLTWGPVRRPEENLADPHWRERETFLEVRHPDLGRAFTEIGAKWLSPQVPWRTGPCAPLLDEGGAQAAAAWAASPRTVVPPPSVAPPADRWALAGVRLVDLSWVVASAGAGRYLAALGAEVIKVEHRTRWDTLRWGNGMVPPGGRAERDAAQAPLRTPHTANPDRGGFFMDINAGKRGMTLNLKHPRGRELLKQLVARSEMIAEGFSPGTLDRLGLGYEALREVNPRIIYAQQSGMGQIGLSGRMRSYGPVAQGMSGLTEMSGLPEPFPPAGIGYSYLDWFGAYNLANAMIAAWYRRQRTGEGCWIDSSQSELGLYLSGTAILDHTANGRRWHRYGNRSPYRPAAPHGIYRAAGIDRWIAIACFEQSEWLALRRVLGDPAWAGATRFERLEDRLAHQDELDRLVGEVTVTREAFALMSALQAAGVPAGVCQTAQDRYETDPQLAHVQWLVELPQREIGTWPVKGVPARLSETPARIGGPLGRHGPSYGEDNEYVYGEILGLTTMQMRELAEQDVI